MRFMAPAEHEPLVVGGERTHTQQPILGSSTVPPYKVSGTADLQRIQTDSLHTSAERIPCNGTRASNEPPEEHFTWMVKPPVRLRQNQDAGKRSRRDDDITVKVRLLGTDTSHTKKDRTPQVTKSPTVIPDGGLHFKVYQVQRRGEQCAKVITGMITNRLLNHPCRPTTCDQSGPRPEGTFGNGQGRGLPENEPSVLLSAQPRLPSELICQFVSNLSPQMKPSPGTPKTADEEVKKCSSEAFTTQPVGVAGGKHGAVNGERKTGTRKDACLSVSAFLSCLAPFNTLRTVSTLDMARDVEKEKLQDHSFKQQQSVALCGTASKNTWWTAQNISRFREAELAESVPMAVQDGSNSLAWNHEGRTFARPLAPAASPLTNVLSSSHSEPLPHGTGWFQNGPKIVYPQLIESRVMTPAMHCLPAVASPACQSNRELADASCMPGSSHLYSGGFIKCGSNPTQKCSDWCGLDIAGEEAAREFDKRFALDGRNRKVRVCDTVNPAPVQREQSILHEICALGRAPSQKLASDRTRSSTGEQGAGQNIAANTEKTLNVNVLPSTSYEAREAKTGRDQYAVTLPQQVRPEEMRKSGEVPVIFKMLHRQRRFARRSEAPAPQPLPSYLSPEKPFRHIINFRVLQQQHPKDCENRRLVAFKAPRHPRAKSGTPAYPEQHFQPTSFPECPCLYPSTCYENSHRLTSTSTTSSLATVQYVHRRTYTSVPCRPSIESQNKFHEPPMKAALSRSASQIVQDTMRRVAKRRAASRSKQIQAAKKAARHLREELAVVKASGKLEKAKPFCFECWCRPIDDEQSQLQTSPGEDNETMIRSSLMQSRDVETNRNESSQRTFNNFHITSEISSGHSEAVEVQRTATEETGDALHSRISRECSDWLLCGRLRGETTGKCEERSAQSDAEERENACERSCALRRANSYFCDKFTSRSDMLFLTSCCRPATRETSVSLEKPSLLGSTTDENADMASPCSATPSVTQVENQESLFAVQPATAYLQPAASVVAPPLYALPVVSFLPPVFEPLPVYGFVGSPQFFPVTGSSQFSKEKFDTS